MSTAKRCFTCAINSVKKRPLTSLVMVVAGFQLVRTWLLSAHFLWSFAAIWAVSETWAWAVRQVPPRLFHGSSAIQLAVASLPNLRRGPRPPWGFSRSFAQFIPWYTATALSSSLHIQRIPFQVVDHHDREDSASPELTDTAFLSFYPPLTAELPVGAPIVMLFPGLTCTADDLPGTHTIRHARSRGYRACVLERRGHRQLLKSPRFQLFGCFDEVDQGIAQLRRLAPDAPLFIYGISAGSALVPIILARRDDVQGGVCCLPGYDTAYGGGLDRAKPPYDVLMLHSMQNFFLVKNSKVLREFNAEAFDNGMAAQTVEEFLTATVSFMGYKTRDAYDELRNPIRYVEKVKTPMLVLNAEDDPISVVDNVIQNYGFGPGRHCDLCSNSEHIILALARSGSHCPFLDGWWPFECSGCSLKLRNWADLVSWDFFDLIRGGRARDSKQSQ